MAWLRGKKSRMIPIGKWLSQRLPEVPWLEPPPQAEVPDDSAAAATLAAADEQEKTEAAERARQHFEALLEAERAAHEQCRAAERGDWIAIEAAAFAVQFNAAMAEMQQTLAHMLVQVLEPFVERATAAKARAEFITALRDHIAAAEPKWLRVKAPADLVAVLRAQLMDLPSAIEFEECATCEAIVTTDTTRLETQIGKWLSDIGGGGA